MSGQPSLFDPSTWPNDTECRWCWEPGHRCVNRDGDPIRADQRCWHEARAQILEAGAEELPHFDGDTYEAPFDYARLGKQWKAVYEVMRDGHWRTLEELGGLLGYPPQSISARLRDFRKEKFGAMAVERRSRGERARGLFEYRLVAPVPGELDDGDDEDALWDLTRREL